MTAAGYAFLGLTIIVAMLAAVLMFAALRFAAAAKDSRRNLGDSRAESALLASALQDAIKKLKEQERATAARAEASERLSGEIVAGLTSGLIVVDEEGIVKIVNPAARRILQLDDITQIPQTRLLQHVPALARLISESLKTRNPVLRQTLTLDRPGGPMYLGVSVSPLAAGDTGHGAICLFRDLTAIIALEEQLRLKEALARLGELTAGLAHEFRNGLATIHGYARLLDPDSLPDGQRPYLEGIRTETRALGEVVTNFLNFAKPDPLALAPVDLGALIRRAAEDVPSALFTFRGEFGRVEADDVLLRQAFSNVFRNSVEARPAPHVPVSIDVKGRIDSQARAVVVDIQDNGPGIDPRALPRLFQPFFTTRPGGMGLGLAIVLKVVVSHNGRISAGNRPEGGAIFTVSLPVRSDQSDQIGTEA